MKNEKCIKSFLILNSQFSTFQWLEICAKLLKSLQQRVCSGFSPDSLFICFLLKKQNQSDYKSTKFFETIKKLYSKKWWF